MVNKKLEFNPQKEGLIQSIFEEFYYTNTSLNKLAIKHNLTVNGLKKVLSNRTYLGEVKFAGEARKGLHKPLVREILFEEVQKKLEK